MSGRTPISTLVTTALMMNLVLEMMNSVLEMMNFVLEITNQSALVQFVARSRSKIGASQGQVTHSSRGRFSMGKGWESVGNSHMWEWPSMNSSSNESRPRSLETSGN